MAHKYPSSSALFRRDGRPRGVATRVFRDDKGNIHVQYHSTVVVSFNDRWITLRTGGWETSTTTARMNSASTHYGLGYRVCIQKRRLMIHFLGQTFPMNGQVISLDRQGGLSNKDMVPVGMMAETIRGSNPPEEQEEAEGEELERVRTGVGTLKRVEGDASDWMVEIGFCYYWLADPERVPGELLVSGQSLRVRYHPQGQFCYYVPERELVENISRPRKEARPARGKAISAPKRKGADVLIQDEGTIVLLDLLTAEAKEWWSEHVESGQTFGGRYVVENRHAADIVEGMMADGLIVR